MQQNDTICKFVITLFIHFSILDMDIFYQTAFWTLKVMLSFLYWSVSLQFTPFFFAKILIKAHKVIHASELQMQSKVLLASSSVFHFEHAQVLGERWPASTCSAVVKPNTNSTVIEAKCLLSSLWLVPWLQLARCHFCVSLRPSLCQTNRQTSTAATDYDLMDLCLHVYCHWLCLITTPYWKLSISFLSTPVCVSLILHLSFLLRAAAQYLFLMRWRATEHSVMTDHAQHAKVSIKHSRSQSNLSFVLPTGTQDSTCSGRQVFNHN